MKRYVQEFANDVMRKNETIVKKGIFRHPGADEIERAVRMCKRGLLTEKETVRAILDIDKRHYHESWRFEGSANNA